MKHRIPLIATLLTVIVAFFGMSVTAAQATPREYDVLNGLGYCIDNPNVNHQVRVIVHCNTDFTFTNPTRGPNGATYYLMRYNGGSDCLNLPSNGGGFVYDSRCNAHNHNELWAHVPNNFHSGLHSIINYAADAPLWACTPARNSRLVDPAKITPPPSGCSLQQHGQINWKFRAS